MKTLKDLFLDELAHMYDAEQRFVRALPKMTKAASCDHLKKALEDHLKETRGHITKIERVFQSFGEKAREKRCETTVGLLVDSNEIASAFKGSPTINAAIVCVAQKIEHFEVASYGCLHEWAILLDNDNAADLLAQILEEEKAANQLLTDLARIHGNQEAMLDVALAGE